mmetsp:Transcript_76059/g.217097  ORF Transcript_76059/g.217097 Transcript_76059/m.217097 type:complete len:295 (+) Transcript_76059:532-1416(+)
MLVRDTVTTTASCTNTSAAATRTNLAPPYRLEKETPWLIKALLQLDANEHVAELLKDTPALPVEGGASGEPEEAPRELSSRIQASALKNDIEASAFERYQDATTWAGSAHPLHDISVHTPLHFIDPSSHCAVQYSDLPGALVGFLTDRVVGAAASGYPVDIVPLQPKSREKLPCELWEMQMLVVGALASKTTESLDEEKQPIATLRKLALQRATIVLEACYRAGQDPDQTCNLYTFGSSFQLVNGKLCLIANGVAHSERSAYKHTHARPRNRSSSLPELRPHTRPETKSFSHQH